MRSDLTKYTLASTVFQIIITIGVYRFSLKNSYYKGYCIRSRVANNILGTHTQNNCLQHSIFQKRLLQPRISSNHVPVLGGTWETCKCLDYTTILRILFIVHGLCRQCCQTYQTMHVAYIMHIVERAGYRSHSYNNALGARCS